jgi:hypothetical protein
MMYTALSFSQFLIKVLRYQKYLIDLLKDVLVQG